MALYAASNWKSDGESHARQTTAGARSAPRTLVQHPIATPVTAMEVGMRQRLDSFGLGDVQDQYNTPQPAVQQNENNVGSSGYSDAQRSATKNIENVRLSPPKSLYAHSNVDGTATQNERETIDQVPLSA